jgi:hypothetical protein
MRRLGFGNYFVPTGSAYPVMTSDLRGCSAAAVVHFSTHTPVPTLRTILPACLHSLSTGLCT